MNKHLEDNEGNLEISERLVGSVAIKGPEQTFNANSLAPIAARERQSTAGDADCPTSTTINKPETAALPESVAMHDAMRSVQPDSVDDLIRHLCEHLRIDPDWYRIDVLRNRAAQWISQQSSKLSNDRGSLFAQLSKDHLLMDGLCHAMFIGECRFLTHQDVKQIFPEELTDRLFANRNNDKPLRIWVVGCGTGEEAYSLVIHLKQKAAEFDFNGEVKILATDICGTAVRTAIRGTYPPNKIKISDGVAQEHHFAARKDTGWRISNALRRLMVITRHDVLTEPPFSRLDAIVCRNLLSDIEPAYRNQVMERFHYALAPDGLLILGENESSAHSKAQFEPVDGYPAHFRQKVADGAGPSWQSTELRPRFGVPTNASARSCSPQLRGLLNIYDELLCAHTHPGFIINEHGELLHSIGEASKYLDGLSGFVSLNLLDLLHPNVRGFVSTAMTRGLRGYSGVVHESALCDLNGDRHTLRVTVQAFQGRIDGAKSLFIGLCPADVNFATPDTAKESPDTQLAKSFDQQRRSLVDELESVRNECATANERLAEKSNELRLAESALQDVSEELLASQQELQAISVELSSVETEHRVAASQLTQLSHEFNTLVSNSEVAVMFLDHRCLLQSFTPAINRMFGIRTLDIGRPIEEIPRRFTWENATADVESVLQTGETIEKEVFDIEGAAYFLRVSRCQSNHDGSFGVVLKLESIEAIRRAQSALQIGAENQWRLLDAVSDAIWVTSPCTDGREAHRLDRVNDMFTQVMGISKRELKENLDAWRKHVHPDDRERVSGHGPDSATGGDATMRYRITHPDGSERWIDHCILTLLGAGNVPNRIAHIAKDLTDLKAADARFTDFLFNTHVALAIVKDGVVTIANQQLIKLTGFSAEEIVGRPFDEVVQCVSDVFDEDMVSSPTGAMAGNGHCEDAKIVRRDGTFVPVEIDLGPVETSDGPSILATFHDLTRLRHAEARIAHANMRLQRSIEELDEFTYAASHDLREPLRKVAAFSNLLPKDIAVELPKRAQDDLDYIIDGAKRMQSLIDGLLTLTRCGKNEQTDSPLMMKDCVDRALKALESRIQEKNAVISVDELPEVIGNRDLITRLYVNLIDNALKFTNPDTIPEIQLTATPGDAWVFGVRDNGIGFDPRYSQRIFAPFKRLQANNADEGAGMGLAICRKIVRQHGGAIWVESSLGDGAHFMFTLNDELEG
ncbi:MAG: PAS domain S-box protein [Phycisphaerales bacterium]|nr:PAS domain S-box protein [Phycisphaerales bacterium]